MEIKNLYEVSGFTFTDKKQAEYFINLVEGKDFNEDQLKEIHSGVENNLVVDYANPSYDSHKMEIIKNSLIYNVKIDYGFEVPSFIFKRKVINGFEQKVNIIPFLLKYPNLSEGKIDALIYGLTLNVANIKSYIQEFNEDQLFEIFYSIEKGVDISIYVSPYFNESQMQQIRFGLIDGVDVSIYAKPEFNADQMEQIRWGLKDRVDVSVYAIPEINHNKMNEIRLGLKKNLDVSIYNKAIFNWIQMRQIRFGLEQGLNVEIYAKPEFEWEQMREILWGLEENLDVSIYAKSSFNYFKMELIRRGLEVGLDVSLYANPKYTFKRMEKIYFSLQNGTFKPSLSTKIKNLFKIRG